MYISKFDKLFNLIMEQIKYYRLNKNNKNISIKCQSKQNTIIELNKDNYIDRLYTIRKMSYEDMPQLVKEYADKIKKFVIESIKSNDENDTLEDLQKFYVDSIYKCIYDIVQDYNNEYYSYKYSYEEVDQAAKELDNYIYFINQFINYFQLDYQVLQNHLHGFLEDYDEHEYDEWQRDFHSDY